MLLKLIAIELKQIIYGSGVCCFHYHAGVLGNDINAAFCDPCRTEKKVQMQTPGFYGIK